jgi:hypothetical protein
MGANPEMDEQLVRQNIFLCISSYYTLQVECDRFLTATDAPLQCTINDALHLLWLHAYFQSIAHYCQA